jgi:hypothetical protein
LAAQGSRLWAFWIKDTQSDPRFQPRIQGVCIPDAATRTTSLDLDQYDVELDASALVTDPKMDFEVVRLLAEWDREADPSGPFGGLPRLMVVDGTYDPGPPETTFPRVQSMVVELWTDPGDPQYGQPTSYLIDPREIGDHQNSALTVWDPAFAVNEYDQGRFGMIPGVFQAFSRVVHIGGGGVYRSNLVLGGAWETPGVERSNAQEAAVAVRAFGIERVFYTVSSILYDGLTTPFPQAVNTVRYPLLESSRLRKDNVYLTCRDATETGIVDLYSIGP